MQQQIQILFVFSPRGSFCGLFVPKLTILKCLKQLCNSSSPLNIFEQIGKCQIQSDRFPSLREYMRTLQNYHNFVWFAGTNKKLFFFLNCRGQIAFEVCRNLKQFECKF